MKKIFIYLFLLLCVGCSINSKFDRGYVVPSSSEPTTISFTTIKDLVIIEAKVNGVKGSFLLDNGFSLSALNADFAEKAGVNFGSASKVKDANNKRLKLRNATLDTVTIGEHSFINTGAFEIDTKRFFPCHNVDGVIGASIINKINWQINYDKQSIRIASQTFKTPGTRLNIAFSDNNSTLTKIKLNGTSFKCKIDLGSTSSLKLRSSIGQPLFPAARRIKNIGIHSISVAGLGHSDTTYQIEAPQTINFGDTPLPVPATVKLHKKLKYPAYLGTGYFKNSLLTINSTEKHYLLSARTDVDFSKKEDTYGISLYLIDNKWQIIRFNPHKPGLTNCQVSDEVETLDSEPISRFATICDYEAYIKNKKTKKESLRLQLKGKDEVIELPLGPPTVD